MDLAAFFAEVNRVAAGGGGGAFAAGLQDAAAAAGLNFAADLQLPADRMAVYRMNLHHAFHPAGAAAVAGGGGGDLLQYLNQINGAPNQRVSDLLSRLFQGQPLNDEERRDLMAGMGIENNLEFDYMSWLFRDAAPGLGEMRLEREVRQREGMRPRLLGQVVMEMTLIMMKVIMMLLQSQTLGTKTMFPLIGMNPLRIWVRLLH
jgi:hypothetical protein